MSYYRNKLPYSILVLMWITWRFSVAERVNYWSRSIRSCSTLSPVSTGMGDCLWAGKLSHYATMQPPRPTQPGHPSVGRQLMSTSNSYDDHL